MPFTIPTEYEKIEGSVYGTLQLAVEQSVYSIADTIFDYSTPEFALGSAIKLWQKNSQKNASGAAPSLVELETRVGAASALLGYIYSQHDGSDSPNAVLATVKTLKYMQPILSQYVLARQAFAQVSSLTFHIAAVDYEDGFLVNNYSTAEEVTQTLGLGLISSSNAQESQDISILASLVSKIKPTVHIYDGVRGLSESNRFENIVSGADLAHRYATLYSKISKETTISEIFELYNREAGSSYKPFEYSGSADAETVVVSFGSNEAVVSKQAVETSGAGLVGAVNVRLFSPFLEEEFLSVLPKSVKKIIVLDNATGLLHATVSTSLKLNGIFAEVIKEEGAPTPELFARILNVSGAPLKKDVSQFVFWDFDNSSVSKAPAALAHTLSLDRTQFVNFLATYNNDILGGLVKSEIRLSESPINTPYSVSKADVTFVNDLKIFGEVDVLDTVSPTGSLIISGPADLEEKLAPEIQREIAENYPDLTVYSLDYEFLSTSASATTDSRTLSMAEQIAFWKITHQHLSLNEITPKILFANGAETELVAATVVSLAEVVAAKGFSLVDTKSWLANGHVNGEANGSADGHANGSANGQVNGQVNGSAEPDADVEMSEQDASSRVSQIFATSFSSSDRSAFEVPEPSPTNFSVTEVAKTIVFKEAYETEQSLRPDLPIKNFVSKVAVNQRVTPDDYDRHIFHLELDITGTGLTYAIGEALGVHASNNIDDVNEFIEWYGVNPNDLVSLPARDDASLTEVKTVYQALKDNLDLFGKPSKKFYENLSAYATVDSEKKALLKIASPAGADDLKKRSEVDMDNYADILREFPSASPPIEDLAKIIPALKRREYSIASSQKVHPNFVHLLIVVVDWVDGKGRKRYGQASKFLADLSIGSEVVVSVKPSVMKLPVLSTSPIIMAGLGTGLAPFKAFLEEKAWQKSNGQDIGDIYLFLGSRHQRQEYLYGELFEAYRNAGILTYIGAAFSRDQAKKIYIQDRIVEAKDRLVDAFVHKRGNFYLCGPTWPVPDISAALADIVQTDASTKGLTIDPATEIEKLKEEERYILEVY